MSKIKTPLLVACFAMLSPLSGQTLNDAEVRISYGELKRLLDVAEPPQQEKVAAPALRSAVLSLGMDGGRLVVNAVLSVVTFGDQRVCVPLVTGGLSVRSVIPGDVVLLSSGGSLCLSLAEAGIHDLELMMWPLLDGDGCRFSLPECPSAVLELASGEAMDSVAVTVGGGPVLAAGDVVPLVSGEEVNIRRLDEREVKQVRDAPVPSTWRWQNQALVMRGEDSLEYQVIVRASADDGSGVSGFLPLPKEAMDVDVIGEDLVADGRIVDGHGVPGFQLDWKTRGILERKLLVTYQMPLRPLDRQWQLEAPGGDDAKTRFVIADVPLLEMAADGLSGPLDASGMPRRFVEALDTRTCRQIEAGSSVLLDIRQVPVVAVEELTVSKALWTVRVEPDGAMLATGQLDVEHCRPVGLEIDTPKGLKLLSCEVGGTQVSPAALEGGWLKVPLAATKESSRVMLSFTGRVEALDPVEGTLALELPLVAHFIRSLEWRVEIPPVYQAEVHGNLTRVAGPSGKGVHAVSLVKNLCRDERPATRVFYQRADLKL